MTAQQKALVEELLRGMKHETKEISHQCIRTVCGPDGT